MGGGYLVVWLLSPSEAASASNPLSKELDPTGALEEIGN
jgi:hypothetical protein